MRKLDKISLYVFVDESYLDKSTVMINSIVIEEKRFNKIIKNIENKFGSTTKLPEIHYKTIGRADHNKRNLAKFYISQISAKETESDIFINLVLADKNKIATTLTGSERDSHIEKIFTRLSITYAINRFCFRYRNVVVKGIFIDAGGKTDNEIFKKSVIKRIVCKSKAKLPKNVSFINSMPQKESLNNSKLAVFIDITDLILGACNNCCSAKPSKDKYKREISELVFNEVIVKINRRRKKIGKINTYPRIKKKINLEESNLSGHRTKKVKYKYYENPELIRKFNPKPYLMIKKWSGEQ